VFGIFFLACVVGSLELDQRGTPSHVTLRSADSADTAEALPSNFIVVVLDDVGVDKLSSYGEYEDPAYTPTLDRLADEGIRFRSAWAMPQCSPTRASLLTGQYPTRTGIGTAIKSTVDTVGLATDSVTLPSVLGTVYDTAAVGKWHLDPFDADTANHPMDLGFARHLGTLGNPNESLTQPRVTTDYDYWERNDSGTLGYSSEYMTTATVDDAITALDELEEPFLLWVAFNAPHTPFHEPPSDLHSASLSSSSTDAELYDAMLEATDTELDRLLEALGEGARDNTTLFVIGDNGTTGAAMRGTARSDRSKGTVYDGGIRVPLIVAGADVGEAGTVSDVPVNVVDLFPTLVDLSGYTPAELGMRVGDIARVDGQSFAEVVADPSHEPAEARHLFAERFKPNGPAPYTLVHRAIRNSSHKLIRLEDADGEITETLYAYADGVAGEGDALDEASWATIDQRMYDELSMAMDEVVTAISN